MLVDEFDEHWQGEAIPLITEFLPPETTGWETGVDRRDLLCELVKIDLESRWRRDFSAKRPTSTVNDVPVRPRVEDYLRRFPELGSTRDFLLDLIEHEVEIRRAAGDEAPDEEYLRRFPGEAEAISALLSEIGRTSVGAPAETISNVKCPTCKAEIALTEQPSLDDISCPGCGESVALDERMQPRRRFRSGSRIGQYLLVNKLGEGAFGVVYRARDQELSCDVALKLARGNCFSKESKAKFLSDAKTAAQLDHPNIVRIRNAGEVDGEVFIASEYVHGETLDKWLVRRPQPPDAKAAKVVARWCHTIALALHHAHEKGVIHRDVKPSNVLLDEHQQPRLIDFGLAKQQASGSIVVEDAKFLGTVAYMSPEQARGESDRADRRSDIYSLGVMLFELLTGFQPFRGSTPLVVLNQHIGGKPPEPKSLNQDVPVDLQTICLKCLEKEPQRRYATAAMMAYSLECFLSDRPIPERPPTKLERAWLWCRENRLVTGLSTAVFVLLLTVTLVLYSNLNAVIENTHNFYVISSPKAETQPDLVLRFGLHESVDWLDLHGQFKPFLEQLAKQIQKQTGQEVRINATIWSEDYDSSIEKLVAGDVDFVRFGPAAYVAARDRQPDVQLLAMELERGDSKHTHESYVFVHKDSGIEQISQFHGRKIRVAFRDAYSTSTVYFKSQLAQAGITADDVDVMEFSKHEDVVDAVGNRVCDVGFVRYSIFNKGNEKFEGALKKIGTVEVPNKPWVASAKLDESVVVTIQNCLLTFNDKLAMDFLKVSGFASATRDEYDKVKVVLKGSEVFDEN